MVRTGPCPDCGMSGDYYDPRETDEVWYCARHCPPLVRDWHRYRAAIDQAARLIGHLLARNEGLDGEATRALRRAEDRLRRAARGEETR